MPSKIENPKNLLAAAWRNFGFSSMGVCCGFANSHGEVTVKMRGKLPMSSRISYLALLLF